jgi:hypothetical protein
VRETKGRSSWPEKRRTLLRESLNNEGTVTPRIHDDFIVWTVLYLFVLMQKRVIGGF